MLLEANMRWLENHHGWPPHVVDEMTPEAARRKIKTFKQYQASLPKAPEGEVLDGNK